MECAKSALLNWGLHQREEQKESEKLGIHEYRANVFITRLKSVKRLGTGSHSEHRPNPNAQSAFLPAQALNRFQQPGSEFQANTF